MKLLSYEVIKLNKMFIILINIYHTKKRYKSTRTPEKKHKFITYFKEIKEILKWKHIIFLVNF